MVAAIHTARTTSSIAVNTLSFFPITAPDVLDDITFAGVKNYDDKDLWIIT